MILSSLLLIPAVAWTPAHTAEALPHGVTVLYAIGGFTPLRVDLPSLPVFPVLTGDVELAWGVGSRADLRLRYSTQLGLVHRLGPELRATGVRSEHFSLAARLHPSTQFSGAFQDGVDYGGDVATLVGCIATWRWARGAITAEAGATAQWLVYEHIGGRTHIDSASYLSSFDIALEHEWPTRAGQSLSLRLELAIPTAPDDPFTVLGVIPRAMFGGSFGL